MYFGESYSAFANPTSGSKKPKTPKAFSFDIGYFAAPHDCARSNSVGFIGEARQAGNAQARFCHKQQSNCNCNKCCRIKNTRFVKQRTCIVIEEPRARHAGCHSADKADERRLHSVEQNQAKHLPPLRTQCDTHANLVCLLRYHIRQHSEQPYEASTRANTAKTKSRAASKLWSRVESPSS